MKTRPLGRTGVQVSELCLGCMMFGGKTSSDDSIRIIHRAIDAGINFLDTANVYSRGRSEEVTGEAVKQSGQRDRLVIATKVHGRMDDSDPNAQGNSRRHIVAQCEASLRRLQTDYIDLYYIHRPSSAVAIDETLRALDDLIRSGKIRYIGTSTFAAWQIIESLWASDDLKLNRFTCEQPPYNLLDRRIERELIPMARTHGIALMPWSPLAGGLLTGKYSRDTPPPDGTRFAERDRNPMLQRRFRDEVFSVVDAMRPAAAKHGATLSQIALAWCLQQPGVTSPIIGPRTMEQLEDNLPATGITLDAEDLKDLDAVTPPGSVISPYYEADFGPSQHRW